MTNAVKNFFKNIGLLFVPMGIFYFSLLFLLCGFGEAAISAITVWLDRVGGLIGSLTVDSELSVKEFLDHMLQSFAWDGKSIDSLMESLKQVDYEWLNETLNGFVETLNIPADTFAAGMRAATDELIGSIVLAAVFSIILLVLAVGISDCVTRMLLRKANAQRTWKKKVIGWIAHPVIRCALSAVLAVFSLWKGWLALPALIMILCADMCGSLALSWLIHRDGKLRFREIVNVKNVFVHLCGALMVVLLELFLFLLLFLFNKTVAILVLVPLTVYSFNIIEINTDHYVCTCLKKGTGNTAGKGTPAVPSSAAPNDAKTK